jgi:hypothetical protein
MVPPCGAGQKCLFNFCFNVRKRLVFDGSLAARTMNMYLLRQGKSASYPLRTALVSRRWMPQDLSVSGIATGAKRLLLVVLGQYRQQQQQPFAGVSTNLTE